MTEPIRTNVERIDLDDLTSEFLTLRVGESIPRLEIAEIRKITNPNKPDNLPGVDFKYIIESRDGRILRVNTWALWKQIAAALRQAGTIQTTLELHHPGVEHYSVRLVN